MHCFRVVGDLMRSAGHRLESVSELDSYLRRPRSLTGHVQVPLLQLLEAAGAHKKPRAQGEPAVPGAGAGRAAEAGRG